MTATEPTTCPHGRIRTPAGAEYDVRTECRLCYLTVRPPQTPDGRPSAPPPPESGPGTELKALLKSLGVPTSGCNSCAGLARQMDLWGVSGCREPANAERILGQLRAKQRSATWATKFRAAFGAVVTGFALKLDPTDPAPGLVEEALRRAETQGAQDDSGKSPPAPDESPSSPASAIPVGPD